LPAGRIFRLSRLLFISWEISTINTALIHEGPVSHHKVRILTLAELVTAAQRGDEQALEELCSRFEPLVKRQAAFAHVRPLGDEVQGEAWLALVQAVRLYDPDSGVPAEGFIASRVRFAVWNLFKRERRRWQSEERLTQAGDDGEEVRDWPAETDTAETAVGEVLGVQLTKLLTELPSGQRQMVERVYLQGMTLQQAGRLSGVSHQAAHKACTVAIKKLRRRLGIE